jgi:NAD(P)H-nitrite reductase large subunit
MDSTQLWLLNNKKICSCAGVTRKVVVTAIKGGAKTVGDVNRATGAGRGSCGGKGCEPKIKDLLKSEENGELE